MATSREHFAEQMDDVQMPAAMAAAVRSFINAYRESTTGDDSFPMRALRAALGLQTTAIGMAGVLPFDAWGPSIHNTAPEQMVSVRLTMPRSVLLQCAAEGAAIATRSGALSDGIKPFAADLIANAADEIF